MGSNSYGQLGDGTYNDALDSPVQVVMSGVSMGKTIEQVYAGQWISFVLTTDKQLFAWGKNDLVELGASRPEESINYPVSVDMTGFLFGKTIAQFSFTRIVPLVLTTDNRLYSCGYNGDGELGDNTFDDKGYPYPVYMDGALLGKTISKIASAGTWSMVLTSDGSLYAWGFNTNGLGDGVTTMVQYPILVGTSAALSGKTIVDFEMKSNAVIVLANDGNLYAWEEELMEHWETVQQAIVQILYL